MPPYCETIVLLPCGSLEDFPTRLARRDAGGVLAALTAAWHPRLIAAAGGMPRWQRADSPLPDVAAEVAAGTDGTDGSHRSHLSHLSHSAIGRRSAPPRQLILLPAVSEAKLDPAALRQLPTGDQPAADIVDGRDWIRVESRDLAVAEIAALFGEDSASSNSHLSPGALTVDDFYALGYLYWQVSVMTRRLRYTGNLDADRLAGDVDAAATAFLSGDADAAAGSLHRCFDALAEERDHYFASDPSLIDLTLTTPTLLAKWLDAQPPMGADVAADSDFLATPSNVLIDDEVAAAVLADEPTRTRLAAVMGWPDANSRQTLQTAANISAENSPGWAGGGPAADVVLDTLSLDASLRLLGETLDRASRLGGGPLSVWGRRGGGLPADLVPPLAAAGIIGLLPHDFASGRELASGETKVILGGGEAGDTRSANHPAGGHGSELEAIVATPLDADDDASFLTLGTRLGQLSDSGEIATALIVRWPGGGCDSFHDLRRAARWGLALGRFWNLQSYFRDGETPYHHASLPVATAAADELTNAKSAPSETSDAEVAAVSGLIEPGGVGGIESRFAAAIGCRVAIDGQDADAVAILNPTAMPRRFAVTLPAAIAAASARRQEVFRVLGGNEVLVDVPAWGHVVLARTGIEIQKSLDRKSPAGWTTRLGRWWKHRRRPVAASTAGWREATDRQPVPLRNEFMDLSVDIHRGGLRGLYAGSVRGNRLSARLVWPAAGSAVAAVGRVQHYKVETVGGSGGRVSLRGDWTRFEGFEKRKSGIDPAQLPPWKMTIDLPPGQRIFTVRTTLPTNVDAVAGDVGTADAKTPFWLRHASLRLALAEGAPAVRVLLRDKWHRVNQRSFLAGGGVLLEESDRQTLLAADGPLAVRRVGERFVDVSMARHDGRRKSELSIGIEVPRPAAAVATLTRTPLIVPLQVPPATTLAAAGWWMHVSRPGVVAQLIDAQLVQIVGGDDPGQPEALAVHVRLIAPSKGYAAVTLRFCRPIIAAERIAPLLRPLASRPDSLAIRELGSPVDVTDDKMTIPLRRHEFAHLIVLLQVAAGDAR